MRRFPAASPAIRLLRVLRRAVLRLALVALIAGLALPGEVGQAASNSGTGCLDHFLVRPGDSLTRIASFYGFDWRVLANLNALQPPYALYAGQWICLPAVVGAEEAAASTFPARLPTFSARASGGWVQIATHNFPVRSGYVVKMADDRVPYGYIWFKLGTLRTRSSSEVTASFRIPPGLKDTPQLRVCLKNTLSNNLMCLTILQAVKS